jgi:hypothetical protein
MAWQRAQIVSAIALPAATSWAETAPASWIAKQKPSKGAEILWIIGVSSSRHSSRLYRRKYGFACKALRILLFDGARSVFNAAPSVTAGGAAINGFQ